MSAVGVKKQYTKFQVLSTVLPKKVEDETKAMLIMTETEFPQKNAYNLLKKEVLRIFGPKPETAVERALGRVLVDKPSQLARGLVNDLCKSKLKNCPCCPAIVACLFKRQLSSQVRAGIAHCNLTAETFNQVVQLADDIHASNLPVPSVAAVATATTSLDETQPAIPYATGEVAAIRGRGGGGGGRGGRGNRGGRNRGGRNRNNRNGQQGQQQSSSSSSGPKHTGTKHPDLPPGDWLGCSMHFKWGRQSFFCSEPATCPWKNVYATKPENK